MIETTVCSYFKNALKQGGITDYLLIELENREDCGEVQDYLQKVTGGRTVSKRNKTQSGEANLF